MTTDMERLEKRGQPIFIVGMNGSGTSMLADCLNSHPLIYIPKFESKVIPYYRKNISGFGNLAEYDNFKKLLNDFANSHAFRRLSPDHPVSIPFDFDKLHKKNLSEAISLTFFHFAAREEKSIWGDHSPKYGLCIPLLVDLFPKAKIIHMIRDCRDCVLSFQRRFRQNIYRGAYQWKKIVQKARHDGSALGNKKYFELKYEELTMNPEHHMRNLFSFLELPFDRCTLNSNMPMYKSGCTEHPFPRTIVPSIFVRI